MFNSIIVVPPAEDEEGDFAVIHEVFNKFGRLEPTFYSYDRFTESCPACLKGTCIQFVTAYDSGDVIVHDQRKKLS